MERGHVMLHGILLVHKIEGGTSHDMVHSIRKLIGQKQVGHAGTLDPMAEGLMVILLGHGTKLSQWLLVNDKKYHFIFRLGLQTDTLDKTGQVIQKKAVRVDIDTNALVSKAEKAAESLTAPSAENSSLQNNQEIRLKKDYVQKVLKSAQGELSLPVPLFSAVKIKGKKMYEYQRAGQTVTAPFRNMCFYDLEIKDIQTTTVEVTLSCKKGSYIRAWVSHIGEQLGTGACLESLTRLYSAPFRLRDALSLKELEKRLKSGKKGNNSAISALLQPAFVPFDQALTHIPAVAVSLQEEQTLRQGQVPIDLKYILQEQQKETNKKRKNQTIRVMSRGGPERMLALLQLKPFVSPRIGKIFPPL